MPRVRPLSLALVIALTVLLPLVSTRDGYAQDASPTAGAWVGSEPDLAAMPITPGDLEAMGLPGFGRFFNGYFSSIENFIEGTSGYYGRPVEEAHAMADRIGLSRLYGVPMGLPSVAGDPESPPARVVYANIHELQNPSEADAFFDYGASAGPETEAQISAVEAPFALGERAMIVNYSMLDAEAGERAHEFFVLFQIDNLIVDTGFYTSISA